jgi:hypothetical protein
MNEDNNIQNDQPIEEKQPSDMAQAKLSEISIHQLKITVQNHLKWLESKGKEGERADLSDENPLIKAHKHIEYRQEILDSKLCGCFRCCQTFSPDEIFQWWGEDENGVEQIAICPKCGIDSVLGSASGFPIENTFLTIMRDYFFSSCRTSFN